MPFQLAEMKGKERIFNIALNTKKETENTKRNLKKYFLRIPKTCHDQRQKNIHRTSPEEKKRVVLKATTVVTFKLSRQVGLGPAVACPANSAGICRFAPPQAEHPGESTNATDCQSSSTHTHSARAVILNPDAQKTRQPSISDSISIHMMSHYFQLDVRAKTSRNLEP